MDQVILCYLLCFAFNRHEVSCSLFLASGCCFVFQIREAPNKHHNKLIEFYDVRAAEAALHALTTSEIGRKQIKLEASHPGGARRGYC